MMTWPRVARLVIAFAGLCALWYTAAAEGYHRLIAAVSMSPTVDKLIQYGFYLSLGLLLVGASWRSDQGKLFHPDERYRPSGALKTLALIVLSIAFVRLMHAKHPQQYADLIDDGPRLASAEAYREGQVPYRDFMMPYGVLQEVVKPMIAFRIWGETYDAFLTLGPWLSALAAWAILAIVATCARSWTWTFLVALWLMYRDDWLLPDRLLPMLLSVWCFCRALVSSSRRWAFAAGVLVMTTGLYSLDVGVPFVGSLLVFAVVQIRTRSPQGLAVLDWGGVGAVATCLIFVGWLVWHGAFTIFLHDTVHLLWHRQALWSDRLPSHLLSYPYLTRRPSPFFFAYIQDVPFLALGLAFYLVATRTPSSVRQSTGWFLSTVTFFQFFIYVGRSDFAHWLTATGLMMALAALVLEKLWRWASRPATSRAAKTAAVGVAAVVAFPYLFFMKGPQPLLAPFWNLLTPQAVTPSERSASNAYGLLDVTKAITQAVSPSGTFYDFSNQGVLYFLTQRKNPTRFNMVDELADPEAFKEFKRAMDQHRPQAVLTAWDGHEIWTLPALYPVRDYITTHYHRTTTGPTWALYTRR